MNDFRLALRMLAGSPGSTATIAGMLALGIGASCLVFSLFDAVLLRPLSLREPARLVRMSQRVPRFANQSSFPYDYYAALRDHSQSVWAFGETGQYQYFGMTDPEPAEQITIRAVTPEFFEQLGARPLYGRTLQADDAERNSGLPPSGAELWLLAASLSERPARGARPDPAGQWPAILRSGCHAGAI